MATAPPAEKGSPPSWKAIIANAAILLTIISALLYFMGIAYWDAYLGASGLSIGSMAIDRNLLIVYGALILATGVIQSLPVMALLAVLTAAFLLVLKAVFGLALRFRPQNGITKELMLARTAAAAALTCLSLFTLAMLFAAPRFAQTDHDRLIARASKGAGRTYVTKSGFFHGLPFFGDHGRIWIQTKDKLVPVKLDDVTSVDGNYVDPK